MEMRTLLFSEGMQNSDTSCPNLTSRFLPATTSSDLFLTVVKAEKLRLQKFKEVVEEEEAPIVSVEDPIPVKSEDVSHVWKPAGLYPST